jgi:hypothetical protein
MEWWDKMNFTNKTILPNSQNTIFHYSNVPLFQEPGVNPRLKNSFNFR